MSDKLNIEQLFRKRLDGAELSPSPAAWKAIQRQLRWKQFLRFNPGKLNIYYAGALLVAATGLVVMLSGEMDQAGRGTVGDPDITLSPSESPANERDRTSASKTISDDKNKEHSADTSGTLSQAEADSGTETDLQDSGSIEQGSETFLKNLTETVPIPLEPEITGVQQAVPATYFTSSIQSGCAPLTVQFKDQSMHASAYLWDFGTGDRSTEKNPVYEFREAGRYVVSLTTENQGKLPTTSRMMIEVLAAPVADFQIEEGLEGIDNHVVLNLVNYSSNGSVFAWNLVDEACVSCIGWSSIEHQPTLELKSITPDSRSVRLEVINENGCSDTAVQALPLIVQSSETRIKFPTAFSPNPSGPGDGSFAPGSKRIDLFHPVYIEVPVEFHMRVYTRRGELVFETRELFRGWDGYLLQEKAKSDVYVWMAEGKYKDGEAFSLRGDVTVVWNQYW
jgi:PKD repeat protein